MNLLAKRAAASKAFRWMPGMAWMILPSGGPDDAGDRGRKLDQQDRVPEGAVPDLEDPATLGCLQALIREAERSKALTIKSYFDTYVFDGVLRWRAHDDRPVGGNDMPVNPVGGFATEAEAFVAMLEVAGKREGV